MSSPTIKRNSGSLTASFLNQDVADAGRKKKIDSGLSKGLELLGGLVGGGDEPEPDHEEELNAGRTYYDDPSADNMIALIDVLGRAGAYRPPTSYRTGG